MKQIIPVKKKIKGVEPGGVVTVSDTHARVLVLTGAATYAPPNTPAPVVLRGVRAPSKRATAKAKR